MFTMSKPSRSWIGTPAEHEFDLLKLEKPTCIFEGVARVAASKYPRNSNIAAVLAFATAGLDNTVVRLMADPTEDKVRLSVQFESAGGNLNFDLQSVPAATNPKTG